MDISDFNFTLALCSVTERGSLLCQCCTLACAETSSPPPEFSDRKPWPILQTPLKNNIYIFREQFSLTAATNYLQEKCKYKIHTLSVFLLVLSSHIRPKGWSRHSLITSLSNSGAMAPIKVHSNENTVFLLTVLYLLLT